MLDYKDKSLTIGKIVAEHPQASQIFGEFGIDFCCGGNRKLLDVIKEQGIDEIQIYEELRLAEEERKSSL